MKAVLAESFERIHRSNLVGMGIIPLQYLPGQNAVSLNLSGHEKYTISILESMKPGDIVDIYVSKDCCCNDVDFKLIVKTISTYILG